MYSVQCLRQLDYSAPLTLTGIIVWLIRSHSSSEADCVLQRRHATRQACYHSSARSLRRGNGELDTRHQSAISRYMHAMMRASTGKSNVLPNRQERRLQDANDNAPQGSTERSVAKANRMHDWLARQSHVQGCIGQCERQALLCQPCSSWRSGLQHLHRGGRSLRAQCR